MATTIYKKVNFVDRLDNKPTTYLIDGKEAKIVKDDSGVVTHGTNLDQENLDHVENGILQNSRDISMLDKVVEKNIEDTTKEITDLKLTDEQIKKDLVKINLIIQTSDIERYNKDENGIFKSVTYRTPTVNQKGKLTMLSELSDPNSEGNYTKQKIVLYDSREAAYQVYNFKLIYSDGELIERKVTLIA
ncbi:TPA: hypothetical protein PTW06_003593 [Clostridium botulinum]|nr:hypothetical protein [Clostridium botulinum]HDK7226264.1 hypothetical protein [Clostridium botulinum]HDK7273654.1 hypothetical protein [Clostridium botulinum]HDK7307002.1 hypothetical protein [Clostridium botulinum]